MVVSNVVVLSVRTIACNGIILDPIDSRIFAKKYHEWWNFRFIFCFIVRHFISVEDIELYMYMYCECITPHPCWKAWICGVSVCVCVCNTSACVCCTAAGWEAWRKHSAWRWLSTDGAVQALVVDPAGTGQRRLVWLLYTVIQFSRSYAGQGKQI